MVDVGVSFSDSTEVVLLSNLLTKKKVKIKLIDKIKIKIIIKIYFFDKFLLNIFINISKKIKING